MGYKKPSKKIVIPDIILDRIQSPFSKVHFLYKMLENEIDMFAPMRIGLAPIDISPEREIELLEEFNKSSLISYQRTAHYYEQNDTIYDAAYKLYKQLLHKKSSLSPEEKQNYYEESIKKLHNASAEIQKLALSFQSEIQYLISDEQLMPCGHSGTEPYMICDHRLNAYIDPKCPLCGDIGDGLLNLCDENKCAYSQDNVVSPT